jgi:hypothetical protein
MDSGVAKKPIKDWDKYEKELIQRGASIIWLILDIYLSKI